MKVFSVFLSYRLEFTYKEYLQAVRMDSSMKEKKMKINEYSKKYVDIGFMANAAF